MQQKSLTWVLHRSSDCATVVASTLVGSARKGGSAMTPSTTTTLKPDSGNQVLVRCGQGRDAYVVIGTATTYYDSSGDPDRIRYDFQAVDRFYNSKTGTEYISHHANTMDFEDLKTGEFEAHGVEYLLTVPGFGNVILDAGKLIFDKKKNVTFASGQHQILGSDPVDTKKLCEALA